STALLEVQLPACDSAEMICPLLVPNAFSPNEDGVNDVFIPIGECQGQQDYLFQVYGRWGNLVFESKNPNEGWKGDTKGKPASSDVYVWVLRYTDPIQNDISMQGDVTLLR
ncbi:MAG: gliding motility-associated C-terminal domain-containing protein, partial [Saprospiraceae bacterium]|nr:gliding motility-associated C-terminal domain-containing protein [Saprospiraceae bacterium]